MFFASTLFERLLPLELLYPFPPAEDDNVHALDKLMYFFPGAVGDTVAIPVELGSKLRTRGVFQVPCDLFSGKIRRISQIVDEIAPLGKTTSCGRQQDYARDRPFHRASPSRPARRGIESLDGAIAFH